MKKKLSQLAAEDGRYNAGALKFVYEGLVYVKKEGLDEPQHVDGQSLCEALRQMALKRWGRLAVLVLNDWGVKTTRDFGELVYLMVDDDWISAQPADSIDDFNDIYDFKMVFKEQFKF